MKAKRGRKEYSLRDSWKLFWPFLNVYVGYNIHFSRSVVSDSWQPHGPQHARLPCPLPTPGAYSNSCPSSRWCHSTISSSVIPSFQPFPAFSSSLQPFPASGSFQMSQFFASGGQSIGVSASASVLPLNIQDWFPLFYFLFFQCYTSILFRR